MIWFERESLCNYISRRCFSILFFFISPRRPHKYIVNIFNLSNLYDYIFILFIQLKSLFNVGQTIFTTLDRYRYQIFFFFFFCWFICVCVRWRILKTIVSKTKKVWLLLLSASFRHMSSFELNQISIWLKCLPKIIMRSESEQNKK